MTVSANKALLFDASTKPGNFLKDARTLAPGVGTRTFMEVGNAE